MRHLWFRFVNAPRGDRGDQQPSSSSINSHRQGSDRGLLMHLLSVSPCSFSLISLLPALNFPSPCSFFSLVQLFWSSPFSLVPVIPLLLQRCTGPLFSYEMKNYFQPKVFPASLWNPLSTESLLGYEKGVVLQMMRFHLRALVTISKELDNFES